MSAELGKYKPYPEYKESGVEWLDLLPSDWKTNALKFALSIPMTDGPHETPTFLDEGVPFVSAEAVSSGKINFDKIRGYISEEDNRRFSLKYKPKLHDVYMIKSGATTGVSAIVETDIKFNIWSPLAVMRANSDFSPYYLLNYLRSNIFQEQVQLNWSFGTQQNIGMGTLENIGICCPPIEEQQSIASFLDYETARIDRLIAKQQQLIELLKEKRQAVISHVVTKGLNPDVPMKDSGVEWLGKVPEHWVVTNLKYLFNNLDYKRIPLSSEERSHKQGEYPYYGASGIIDYVDDYLFQKSHVLVGEDGANLISRTTPLAFNATGQYWVNNHAHILDFKDELNDYWVDVINNIDFKPFISGSAQPKLTAEALGNIKVAFPPDIHERVSLYDCIKSHTPIFNQLIDKAVLQISLLNEKRKNLISSAVTGKIDLRNWAPPVIPSDDVA